ncbi:MAG: class E sortase [Bifidobacteriaceae bacterium]|jgi:sortase A|nr:class E sortase [Bifidobacteriaceae bacterium]
MSGSDGLVPPDRASGPDEDAGGEDAPVTLANLDAILAVRRTQEDDASSPDDDGPSPPKDPPPAGSATVTGPRDASIPPDAPAAVAGAPIPREVVDRAKAESPGETPAADESATPVGSPMGRDRARTTAQPPRWAEVGQTDPGGMPSVPPPPPREVVVERRNVAGHGHRGEPIRPEGGLTRAQLRHATSVHAVQAAQTGATEVRGEANAVLTIPWPQVPASDDSDPRRRIPVGAIITGVLGEILMTVGVILGLYVVWEIMWSTVEARPAQAHALEVVHVRAEYVPPITVVDVGGGEAPVFAPEYTDNFPEIAGGDDGQPWLSLHVPRWGYGYNVAIAEGTDDPVIDKGLIGHYPDTQNAGEMGNFATAAHRITHGEPFARIQELHNGDELIVETDEYFLIYEMYDQQIVDPTEMSVIWPVPGQAGIAPERRLITLTTCHPRYTSTHRYIVWGELQYWTKKSEGPLRALTPPALRGDGG